MDLELIRQQTMRPTTRPRLVEVFREAGRNMRRPYFAWERSDGMGGYSIERLSLAAEDQVGKLVDKGFVVSTFDDHMRGHFYFNRMAHFDDVQWGQKAKGQFVIYAIDDNGFERVMKAGLHHRHALALLQQRINDGMTLADTPIHLVGHGKITPILTNPAQIALRRRQTGAQMTLPPVS